MELAPYCVQWRVLVLKSRSVLVIKRIADKINFLIFAATSLRKIYFSDTYLISYAPDYINTFRASCTVLAIFKQNWNKKVKLSLWQAMKAHKVVGRRGSHIF
jgi:hypothetical protein